MIKRWYIEIANNMHYCIILYAFTIAFASVTFMTVEDFDFHKAVWFSFITSLTIGYGDVSPATTLGKIFTIVFALQWILFIIPCFLVNMIDVARRDNDKFSHEEQEQLKNDVVLLKQQNAEMLFVLRQLQARHITKQ